MSGNPDRQPEERPGQLIRCPYSSCPSSKSGGRVLLRVHRGVVYIEVRLRAGEWVKAAVYGTPINAVCPSCGRPWLNPDAVASDGLGGVIERTIKDIAERVVDRPAKDPADETPRRRLRRAA